MRNYIGIDPGISGAFAVVNAQFDIVQIGRFTSFTEFFQALQEHKVSGCCVEAVRLFSKKQGLTSSATFMKQFGGVLAILEVLNIRHHMIDSKAWQNRCNVKVSYVPDLLLSKEQQRYRKKKLLKAKSVERAVQFFGLTEKIDHDVADALHMARCAVETFEIRAGLRFKE